MESDAAYFPLFDVMGAAKIIFRLSLLLVVCAKDFFS